MTIEGMSATVIGHELLTALKQDGVNLDDRLGNNTSAYVRELAAHLSQHSGGGEVVAYRYALESGKWTVFQSHTRAKFLEGEGAIVEPLYSRPVLSTEVVNDYTIDGFGDWLNSAYSFKEDGHFTRFNMEVAFAAGMEHAALTHPRPVVEKDSELATQLRGRAQFLRERGEIKSPRLMEAAANQLATPTSNAGRG